jgi:hypothetical protein
VIRKSKIENSQNLLESHSQELLQKTKAHENELLLKGEELREKEEERKQILQNLKDQEEQAKARESAFKQATRSKILRYVRERISPAVNDQELMRIGWGGIRNEVLKNPELAERNEMVKRREWWYYHWSSSKNGTGKGGEEAATGKTAGKGSE